MYDKESISFEIDYVVNLNLPGTRRWKAPNYSYDITCPFCNGVRKMNINISKNVARCNKCSGDSGYNAITLHAKINNLSTKEAYKDLLTKAKGLEGFSNKSKEEIIEDKALISAPIEIRDKVYRKLLSQLSLSKKHKEDLLRRGLNSFDIENSLYKSVPVCGFHSLAFNAVYKTDAHKYLENNRNTSIPGFSNVLDREKITIMPRKSGYFIPVVTRDNLISFLQIRYDYPTKFASKKERESFIKYSRFSSSNEEGGVSTSGLDNIHFSGHINEDYIYLTEGPLKADISSNLLGKPFMGLTGVNNIGHLNENLSYMYSMGVRNVYLAIDMDYHEKDEVKKALNSIKKTINMVTDGITIKDKLVDSYVSCDGPFDESLNIRFNENLPESILLFFGKKLIPSKNYIKKDNVLEIDYTYLKKLPNVARIISIIKITKEFDSYRFLDSEKRKAMLKENIIYSINYDKKGLKYKALEWNHKYKGIDDYLLSIRKK